jgi:hypothetical protein
MRIFDEADFGVIVARLLTSIVSEVLVTFWSENAGWLVTTCNTDPEVAVAEAK